MDNHVFGESQQALHKKLDRLAEDVESQVIAWRRDIHEHPELSLREFRTGKIVAEHLSNLGMEVRKGVGKTGVVGVLRGTSDKPVVALRADMDALPITETADLPFASKVQDTWNGKKVGVMHACGHDVHTAMLMGAAEVLAKACDRLPGTVKFIFQPAEEIVQGAGLMVKDGVLENPTPDAIFALHVINEPVGTFNYRSGYYLSSAYVLSIDVIGPGGHGAFQWQAVNPVIVASQIVLGLQTIVSSQIDIYGSPCVVSLCMIHGGDKENVIPEEVNLAGTVRFFGPEVGRDLAKRITRTATQIAASAGAKAEVEITDLNMPAVYNDPELTRKMTPTLMRVAGKSMVRSDVPWTPSGEDFFFFCQNIPGLYIYMGVTAGGNQDPGTHSPDFVVDERALIVGVRALSNLAVDYLVEQSNETGRSQRH